MVLCAEILKFKDIFNFNPNTGFCETPMLAMFTGMVAYAYFQECNPFSAGWISKTDQTIPYLAVKILNSKGQAK